MASQAAPLKEITRPHAPPGWACFLQLPCTPTAHTRAQASLVGKPPSRSPWGASIPAEDLLRCAFSGPFLSTLHTDPRLTQSWRLGPSSSVSSPVGDGHLVFFASQATWPAPSADPCVCSAFSIKKRLQANAQNAAAQAISVLCSPSASKPPVSGPRAKNDCSSRKCPSY